MKSINLFKYKNTKKFANFLSDCKNTLDDVVGFSLDERKQYHGNIWKEYCIYFKDDECAYFKAVIFKDFHEYHQANLGFKGNKLFDWFESADIREYKENKY